MANRLDFLFNLEPD